MKKGAIQIETIIVIILALLALVIIAAAFTGGFNKLWSQLTGSFGVSSVTADAAMKSCNGWCEANAANQFCTHQFVITGRENEGAKTCINLGASCPKITC
jgi:archaellin